MATPPSTSTGQSGYQSDSHLFRQKSLPRDILVGVTRIKREPEPIPTAVQVVRPLWAAPALPFSDAFRLVLNDPLIRESFKREKVSAKHW